MGTTISEQINDAKRKWVAADETVRNSVQQYREAFAATPRPENLARRRLHDLAFAQKARQISRECAAVADAAAALIDLDTGSKDFWERIELSWRERAIEWSLRGVTN